MKKVYTAFNEEEHKRFSKDLARRVVTWHTYLKNLVYIDQGDKEKAHIIRTSIIYGFTLYSLVISAVLLVF